MSSIVIKNTDANEQWPDNEIQISDISQTDFLSN